MKLTDKLLQEFKEKYPHKDFDNHNCEKSGHSILLTLEVYNTKKFFQTKQICLICKEIILSKKEKPFNEDDIEIYEIED
jgi:hypothetical protein